MRWALIFSSLHIAYINGTSLSPYSEIELLPEWDFGWYVNRESIEAIFKEKDIRVVVEIGSWGGGGSTRHFGTLLKAKGGTLHAVDTWLGNITQQPGQPHYQPTVLPHIYQLFLSNMIHWDLTNTVIPHRMTSLEASQVLNVAPDLVYIDAEHTYEAVYQDLTAWYPFVKGQGILCGDDWYWPEVERAVTQFASENNLSIEPQVNFWRLKELK